MPITLGTSGGNKNLVAIYVGTAGGNKSIVSGYVGTIGGNKLIFNSFTPSTTTYTSGSGTITIPFGASRIFATIDGHGGNGGASTATPFYPSGTLYYGGPGGGSGARSIINRALIPADWGTVLNWSVASGGSPSTASGTLSSGAFSMSAGNGTDAAAGGYSGAPGTGGTATGMACR